MREENRKKERERWLSKGQAEAPTPAAPEEGQPGPTFASYAGTTCPCHVITKQKISFPSENLE